MTIPTYSIIPDSDIDPESPITQSLMQRLRDNALALLGIDNTNPTPTPVVVGPSALVVDESQFFDDQQIASQNNYTAGTTEIAVGKFNRQSELVLGCTNEDFTGSASILAIVGFARTSNPIASCGVSILHCDVTYVGGVATSVALSGVWTNQPNSFDWNCPTGFNIVAIPANNTWTTIAQSLTGPPDLQAQAKARFDSGTGKTWLQFRCISNASGGSKVDVYCRALSLKLAAKG